MQIRVAQQKDVDFLLKYDKHVDKNELYSLVALGRILIAEDNYNSIGWLRWNLFWDNTPFVNMLFLLEEYRNIGHGKEIMVYWEKLMKESGYGLVMTSTLSNEQAQHFYRKLNYLDSGSLLLKGEPMEIIFTKEI